MPSLFSRFKHNHTEKKLVDRLFIPSIDWNPEVKLPSLKALAGQVNLPNNFEKYPKTLMIGVGLTGKHILKQWLDQLAHEQINRQKWLKAIVIGEPDELSLESNQLDIFTKSLSEEDKIEKPFWVTVPPNPRSAMSEKFRNSKIEELYDLIDNCVHNFVDGFNVFLLGSISEPTIGIMGDVLQVLQLSAIDSQKNVTAILTTQSENKVSALTQQQQFATLREILRMAVNNTHIFPALPNLEETVFNSALLDWVFIVDDVDQKQGEAASELLYTLAHPSADLIWESLQNLHQSQGVGFHTVGIATHYVPINDIKDYITYRLTKAVLFGEGPDDNSRYLFHNNLKFSQENETLANTAKHWLLSGPNKHEFFNWFADLLISPERYSLIPSFSSNPHDYTMAFGAQIANSLTEYLNHSEVENGLLQAYYILQWITKQFTSIESKFRKEKDISGNIEDREKLIQLVKNCKELIDDLLDDWKSWIVTLGLSIEKHDLRKQTSSLVENSSKIKFSSFQTEPKEKQVNSQEISDSFLGFLNSRIQRCEDKFTDLANDKYRTPLIGDGINEIREYYKSTIRPELGTPGKDEIVGSSSFKNVRERLSWLVNIEDHKSLRLHICFVPFESSEDYPNKSSLFGRNNFSSLIEAIDFLSRLQSSRCIDDFSTNFGEKSIRLSVSLANYKEPLLPFEKQLIDSRNFIIARNSDMNKKLRDRLFSVSSSNVYEIPGGEPSRCTLMSIWPSIPFETIRINNGSFISNRPHNNTYMYSQEMNAAIYERLIKRLFRDKTFVFSPAFTTMLADQRLTTLFCQALFCNMLQPIRSNSNDMLALQKLGDFLPLELTQYQSGNLNAYVDAFRAFTLEKPYQRQNKYSLNPDLHFGNNNKEKFLNFLHRETIRKREEENFPQCENLLIEKVKNWQQVNDEKIREFLALLAIELEEAVWSGF